MAEIQTYQARLSAAKLAEGETSGEFEVLAITAGEGNGWTFPTDVLRQSLPLWDGVETFVDHAAWGSDLRSLRDLGGVCSEPAFDEAAQGIRLRLRTAGPSSAVVDALAREWLAASEPRARVGLSADLIFTARGKVVERILRVISLDMVYNPARGGAFVRALNSAGTFHPSDLVQTPQGGGQTMTENSSIPASETGSADALQLETALNGCKLPPALQNHLRGRFSGKPFDPQAFTQAVDDARSLLAEVQSVAVIRGAGQVSGMVTAEERLQAAVDDLFGAPRDESMANVTVEKLSGIRELYVGVTGDVNLHGGYDRQQARFSTTATLPSLVKNTLNKMVVQQWDEMGRAGYNWWEKLVTVEHFTSLNEVTGVLVGEVGALPKVNEGAAYPELTAADSEETAAWEKYGGYLPLTLELIDRDNLSRIKTYPRKLVSASLRKISRLVADLFTASGGVGPTLKEDSKALFHVDHGNLGTGALSGASWEAACQSAYNQKLKVDTAETTPPAQALDLKYLLVPRALRLAAMQILYPNWERQAQIFSENMQKGEAGDVICCPEFSDANDWAGVCDPRLAPAVYVCERFGLAPEIFIAGDEHSPAMFSNDEMRLKVRHFLAVFVADYRPLFKANVA